MIEIKKNNLGKFKLFISDKEVDARVHFDRNRDSFSLNTNEDSVAQQLTRFSFNKLPDIYFLAIPVSVSWSKPLEKVFILNSKMDKYEVKFRFSSNTSKWRNKKNYFKYFSGFSVVVNEFKLPTSEIKKNFEEEILGIKIKTLPHSSYGFEVTFTIKNLPSTLSEEIDKFIKILKYFNNQALKVSASFTKEKTILSSFEFPEELKIYCEQYLLYFARFLHDLGIKATSSLQEEAGKVLFSITPTDDTEALDKIRESLAVYLNLPSSPVLYNDSFQSMQLKQQVENLQHWQTMKEMEMRSAQYALRLAQQNIENQDKIITLQNSFIDNQNKIVEKITSKSVMIDSLEDKEELEKFWEGFEVGKSEFLIKHFGLHLNPATVLKNVGKKILGKEESKSILDLNEETNQEDN